MIFLSTCVDCPRQRRMNGITRKNLIMAGGLAANSCDDDDDMDDSDVDSKVISSHQGIPSTSAGANASVVSTVPLNMGFRAKKSDGEMFSRGQVRKIS